MLWSDKAWKRLLTSPDFVRSGIRKAAERRARKLGLKEIDSAHLTTFRNEAMMKAVKRILSLGYKELTFDAFAKALETTKRLKDNPQAEKRLEEIREYMKEKPHVGVLGEELMTSFRKYLAGEGIKRVAVLGTGRISRNLALACDELFELDEIRCTSRKAENRAAFAAEVGSKLKAELRMTESIAACVDGAEAVLTAVPTPEPILTELLLAGVGYVAVIAGDGRTRQLALEVLQQRGVVVDVLGQAQKSGEFRAASEVGAMDTIGLLQGREGKILDIGDAACGRLGDSTPSVVYLTGMGAQDLCSAAMVYEGPAT
ncbi:MAG TPA: hypothetical protein EYQ18_12405 [Candidatus Handelsmanbacteria bacterium]|nr:hypothetical protein [Candidatus Handelsmanbacteria bacterium]